VWTAARRRLDAGQLALRGVLDDIDVHRLESDDLAALDPEGRALWNVNTSEDLDRARGWLGPAPGRA
jgi:molybdopterin-guanine dinucleotide biosynthesis protein A